MESYPSDGMEELDKMMDKIVPIPEEYLGMFSSLSDLEFGRLIRWCMTYYTQGDPDAVDLPANIQALKLVCKANMDQALEARSARIQANRENGKKGGRPKKTQETQDNPKNPLGFGFPEREEESGERASSLEEKKRSKRKEDTLQEKEEKEEEKLHRSASTRQERFDRFWSIYPKKVGKQAAYKSWSRINPTDDLTEEIVSAVNRQKGWSQWTREQGRYIPNPATWLNQGRWEDEEYGSGDYQPRDHKETWTDLGGHTIGTGSF